jgi:hypothetical protein
LQGPAAAAAGAAAAPPEISYISWNRKVQHILASTQVREQQPFWTAAVGAVSAELWKHGQSRPVITVVTTCRLGVAAGLSSSGDRTWHYAPVDDYHLLKLYMQAKAGFKLSHYL